MSEDELRFWTAALWSNVEWRNGVDKDGFRECTKGSEIYLFWWDTLQAQLTRVMGLVPIIGE